MVLPRSGPVVVLQWGHGISAVESACGRSRKAFEPELQWGHGISAVESGTDRDERTAAENASMGPRHFCRGISRLTHNTTEATITLQWGHGISAVESATS